MNKQCMTCLFADVCVADGKCSSYCSVDEEECFDAIEQHRDEFYKEWFMYIGQDD